MQCLNYVMNFNTGFRPFIISDWCENEEVWHPKILRFAHTVYLFVFCGSQNKQRLFPYTALTDWFV